MHWKHEHGPMILRSLGYMPTKVIAEMYGVSHKWLKRWLRQNYPHANRRRINALR